ncbi:MAG: hypothetical protein KIS77_10155 [Saprospiraceae bacterium]|nr:hypothetical protein [Saprospiraceae bacterium]
MRTLFIAVALLAILPGASACDVCGCSIGGNYFGILPQFHRHFVGLRWSEQSFQSAHSRNAAEAGHFDSDESFRTVDLLGRFYPFRRIQMLVLMPYHDFRRLEGAQTTHTQGLGDASIMAGYILLDTGDSLDRKWQHTLTLNGGVKLPTGDHNRTSPEGKLLHPNLQSGSGTTDFMLAATYTLRRGAWGFTADALGRLNTTNRQHDYRFGNRISGSAKAFYWKNKGRLTFLPNAGVFADAAQANTGDRDFTEGTGGAIALATAGLDVYMGRFSTGFTFQHPFWQHLGDGKVHSRNRWMATLNYIF